MDNKLINRLKEFYKLETFQVAYYEAQVSSATDYYYKKAFAKLAQIEKGHVDFFAQKLVTIEGEVPKVTGSLFDLAGSILGESIEITGQYNTCKLGVALENKAMKTYRDFIAETKEKDYVILQDVLLEYLLDEEFHALWLKDYMAKLSKA